MFCMKDSQLDFLLKSSFVLGVGISRCFLKSRAASLLRRCLSFGSEEAATVFPQPPSAPDQGSQLIRTTAPRDADIQSLTATIYNEISY